MALELASSNYDIWITNSRGTVYSNDHIKYKVTDKEFWEFSFQEMGKYDVNANVNYILSSTGFE